MSEMRPAVRNTAIDHARTASEARLEIAGRILLATGEELPCLVRCIAGDSFEITGVGHVAVQGTRVVCRTTALGTVAGSVRDALDDGFRMEVIGGPHLRARLASRLAWHLKASCGDTDLRSDARIIPNARAVRVRTQDGVEADAELIDVSSTGAALRMSRPPPAGSRITVGRRRADVVRHLDGGIAVRLVLPLRPDDVTTDLVL
ncbi:MAG: pilus assembly protein PilZ [Methylorubrum populi]